MKDGSPYAFAGLWERWRDPATRESLETFTVITTDPNELVEPLHNRMPVILQPKDYDRWLTPGETRSVLLLICCGLSRLSSDHLEGGSQGRERQERHAGLYRADD
jgi:putative SOS response-associated peptidase YedK